MMDAVTLLIFLIQCLSLSSANEVVGCGGFLKSHVPIDFSKVEVKLVTKQGIVKDKTTAAPNNGYYFVPLYDKGEMLLELSPPPGWSFEPRQVALTIDGTTDLCSKGKDINFVFQGFGITGKVESFGSDNGGPEGVTVYLESKDEVTKKTKTDKEGNFFFTPVYPGNHKVHISHEKWKILKESVTVKVAESNTELPRNSLVVQGYEVKGKVKNEGELLKDAYILMYSTNNETNVMVEECIKEPLMNLKTKSQPLCYSSLKDDGSFLFKTVPNGKYYLTAYYKGQNIFFHPDQIQVQVDHCDVSIEENFEIIGFSIPGKVVKARNKPIANAKIFLNGKEIAKTDATGSYTLEKMKAGTYRLRAEADDLIFEERIVRLNPSLQELPDLLPSAYKVCGIIRSEDPQIVTFSKIGSTNFVQTETSPKDGIFCQYLSPGKYEVQVIVSDLQKQKGLQFFPIVQVIEVASDQITNIVFSQLKTTISGTVKCIQPQDCEGLRVAIKAENVNEVILKIKDGVYSVSDMFPGSYEISLLPNKFCWESNTHILDINTATAQVPAFIQKGYAVNFMSSDNTQIQFVTLGEQKISKVDIKKGKNSYCLETPGEYSFNLESCHTYSSKSISYNTNAELNEIVLKAIKHTLKLAIKAEPDFDVSVQIGKEQKPLTYLNGKYELSILLEPGENVLVVPLSQTLFFTPSSLSVVGKNDCTDLGVQFVGVEGKVFKGKVIPPLAGVTMTVESSDSETLVVETDSNGAFKFPTLDDRKKYKISAKKESYILTGPDSHGNFLAHKLAEVMVDVVDGSNNSPLTSVLLSLSGGESYRKNLQSNEDGGVSFHSLSPGEYFLRPMMKEYIFEPNSKIISVKEGESVKVRLVGKRVAYSAFGKIVSLNGEPEENMVIVASGIGNCSRYSEETTCEATGQFRIRGLQPYCSYKIEVKGSMSNNIIVERSAPEFLEVNNVQDDVTGLNLIVFRPAAHMDVLVKVYAADIEHYKHLKLKLSRELGSAVTLHTVKIDSFTGKFTKCRNPGILINLPSIPLDNRPYSLQLESSLAQNSKWQLEYFDANTTFRYFQFDFNGKSSITDQPMKQTSIWSLIFIFTILLAIYNIELVFKLLKDKLNVNINSLSTYIPITNFNQKNGNDYYDDAEIDQIVQSINNAKRKPKPKVPKILKK